MNYEVEIGDRVRAVGVVRKGTMLHVSIDGATYVVDAQRVGESALSLLVHAGGAAAPRSVDVSLAATHNGDFDVHVNGHVVPLQVRPAGSFGRQKKAGAGSGASGPQRVLAPMPGKVVRVLVKPGDEVKARQGLVVVEAMKMENELKAARDGRVRDVTAREGQSVDAGAVLLVVE